MSYDVYLTTPACAACRREGSDYFRGNMTSNVSGIWFRALMVALGKIVPADWGSFDGSPPSQWTDALGAFGPLTAMTGADAIPVLDAAAKHILDNPSLYAPFEPENRWGSAVSAAQFLQTIATAWKMDPTARLWVSR